ncbi:hypothetical protein [Niastella populi]|uniref:Uncharacterized protein n=1 Tax=Niastella populi TaxID=550983 RepID=A0A1V9FLV0_9BACT|nr:hypothetical protein [Niastella populi]OQP59320.1 hypothetical protein A4R26_21105 [Niastella populi]
MKKRTNRWVYVSAIGVLIFALLFVYRLDIMFAFQRMRLNRLGCTADKRVAISASIDVLPVCEKLWAHRVNGTERMMYLKDYFSGLETDVVFDGAINNFRVYHPPAAPSALLLDEYFKQFRVGNKGLWIDVKGVDRADYKKAVEYFMVCDSLYNIKNYVIIEAAMTPFINLLAEKGFITSYYVPVTFLLPETPDGVTDSLRQQLSPAVKFVSQEDIYLSALRSRFQNRKIITWALSFKNYLDLSHIKTLINDTSISVVLINCKSKGYL